MPTCRALRRSSTPISTAWSRRTCIPAAWSFSHVFGTDAKIVLSTLNHSFQHLRDFPPRCFTHHAGCAGQPRHRGTGRSLACVLERSSSIRPRQSHRSDPGFHGRSPPTRVLSNRRRSELVLQQRLAPPGGRKASGATPTTPKCPATATATSATTSTSTFRGSAHRTLDNDLRQDTDRRLRHAPHHQPHYPALSTHPTLQAAPRH